MWCAKRVLKVGVQVVEVRNVTINYFICEKTTWSHSTQITFSILQKEVGVTNREACGVRQRIQNGMITVGCHDRKEGARETPPGKVQTPCGLENLYTQHALDLSIRKWAIIICICGFPANPWGKMAYRKFGSCLLARTAIEICTVGAFSPLVVSLHFCWRQLRYKPLTF